MKPKAQMMKASDLELHDLILTPSGNGYFVVSLTEDSECVTVGLEGAQDMRVSPETVLMIAARIQLQSDTKG